MKNTFVELADFTNLIRLDYQKINLFMGVVHIFWLFIFYIVDVPLLFWTNLLLLGLHGIYVLMLKKNSFLLFYGLAFCQAIGVIILSTIVVGWEAGFQHYLVIFPAFVFTILKGWQKYAIVTISGGVYLGLYYWAPLITNTLSTQVTQIFYIVNIVGVITVLVFISSLFGKTNQKVLNKLNDLSRIDPLTRSFNRRSMYQYLREAKKQRKQSYVLLADLDDFKSINDHWGHECGDEALIYCTEVFRSFTKGNGAVSRWGGEEFLILFHAESEEDAIAEAESIAEAIQQRGAFRYQQQPIPLSMTGGLAKLDPATHVEKTISAADEALYLGKQQGKNQIVYVSPLPEREEKVDSIS